MISKGSLVRYVGDQSTHRDPKQGKVYLAISDSYDWTGNGWQGSVIKVLDPAASSRQTVIALDLLDLVSQ